MSIGRPLVFQNMTPKKRASSCFLKSMAESPSDIGPTQKRIEALIKQTGSSRRNRIREDSLERVIRHVLGCTQAFQLPSGRLRFKCSPMAMPWGSCHHGILLSSMSENAVCVVFVREAVILMLTQHEAQSHNVVNAVLSRKFQERPSTYLYYDPLCSCTLRTPAFVFLEEILTSEFLVGDWSPLWAGQSLHDLIFQKTSLL